jgi:riboflavin synthase
MFTGIVAAVGRIEAVEPLGDGARLRIDSGALGLDDVGIGDSIAIQGACMTAVKVDGRRFEVEV